MKLLITVVQAYDADRLLRGITSVGLSATKINSLGGFLRMTNATILIGLENHRVSEAIEIIRETCQRRVEVKMDAEGAEYSEWLSSGFHEVPIGGAVVFAMPLKELYRIWPSHIEHYEETPV